ncbi:MAG: hypothetical protein AABW73_03215 [Nanoarchaeota archaeon]
MANKNNRVRDNEGLERSQGSFESSARGSNQARGLQAVEVERDSAMSSESGTNNSADRLYDNWPMDKLKQKAEKLGIVDIGEMGRKEIISAISELESEDVEVEEGTSDDDEEMN